MEKMRKLLQKLKRKEASKPEKSSPSAPDVSETYGLELIHDPRDSTLDIIALHGQGGHRLISFTDRNTGTFWLKDLLPHVLPQARIWSFGYGAHTSVIEIVGQILKETRANRENGAKPILWIAHSFGGLILKAVLALDWESGADVSLFNATEAVLFFGVHQEAKLGIGSLGLTVGESDEIKKLRLDAEWLQEKCLVYDEVTGKEKWEEIWFLESAEGGTVIVDGEDGNNVRLGKTHGGMIRFSGKDDEDWKRVERSLQGLHKLSNCIRRS